MKQLFFVSCGSVALAYLSFFAIYVAHPLEGNVDHGRMSASVFFAQSVSVSGLQEKFKEATTTERVKVLLVPGHEPDFGGAEFRDLRERDLAVDLGRELAAYLSADPHYEVLVTRSKEAWNPEFKDYFAKHFDDIKTFVSAQKTEMSRLETAGRVVSVGENVPHNAVSDDVAFRLYGINKYANEHKVDITLHIHFNDYAPRKPRQAGEYNGFTIYIPDKQYSNALATSVVAQSIFKRLAQIFPVSNLPQEDGGVVPEQDLIAVGSNNTADGVSILIEYGYIYENAFADPSVRALLLKELALRTYLGLEDFFGDQDTVAGPYETAILPHRWNVSLRKSTLPNNDTLALQAALLNQGFYPPNNASKNDCPLTGVFGSCTASALARFQDEFGIPGTGTLAGEQTRAKLNELYGEN